jgi:putative nucleotidyltransferase with HDIG domain
LPTAHSPFTQKRHAPRVASALGIALATTVLLSLALSVNLLPRDYQVREGEVAANTIKAPRRASYVSQIRTRDAREQAAAQVAPIVDWDSDRIAQQKRALTDLTQAIAAVRNSPTRTLEQRRDAIRQLANPPLSEATARRIAELDDTGWTDVAGESQRLLWDALKDRITEGTVEEVRNALPLRVSPFLPEANRSVAIELASRFLRANVVVNQEATERARREARESVTPVVQMYEAGQTIVRDGQVIGPLELEALEALNLRNPEVDWRSIGGASLLAALLVAILALYVWQFDPELLYRDRRMVLLGAVLVVTTVAAKLVISNRPLWVYVFPLPAVAMLLSALLEARLAIVVGALLSVILGWVAGSLLEVGVTGLEVGVVGVAGTTVGALAVWRKERLHSYGLAGLYVAAAQLAALLAFFLASRSDEWQRLSEGTFALGVNGLLSSLLTIGSIALVGRVFGILTTMQLLELANPTQPLLRRLLMEAPGTYHHSIIVGNLAERAAEVIGADPLLVRVASYYHDIGKLERPWAFIENQEVAEENIHESLDPAESAQIIAAHVSDGVRLAERFGLPPRIRDMIPQHHGTRTISFFYQQAAERTVGNPDPALFTYPGPRPQSREAAILMLADSTEAAARASRDHSREAIDRLVEQIVRQRLEEGQFDECDLTLRDLTMIKESFVTLLTGIYHPRIPYPPSKPPADGASRPAQRAVPSDVSA